MTEPNRDLKTLAASVAEKLVARGETVAVSESSAGGLISAALLAIPGASKYYAGGGVIYTRPAHKALFNMTRDQLSGIRSSSEPYAEINAAAVREKIPATWGLAETGAAGPSGNGYGDPAGHTCLAVAGPKALVRTLRTGSDDREANMWAFTAAALTLLEEALDG